MASDTDFGLDWSTFVGGSTPDLDPAFTEITGPQAVAETLARGLLMPRGRLVDINDTQKAGFDLRRFLSVRVTPLVLLQIKAGVEQEAHLDERVDTANVTVAMNQATSTLTITIRGTTNQGPFELVATTTKLKTDIQILSST